jgi:pilus assembly protein CpaF
MIHLTFQECSPGFEGSREYISIKTKAHEHLLGCVEKVGMEFSQWGEQRIKSFVETEIERFVQQQRLPINAHESQQIAHDLFKEINGLGPLDDLMSDHSVEDILINGHKQVFVSRHGVMQPQVLHFADDAHLLRIIQRVIAPLGRRLDESTPMVDARLSGGGRLNAVIPPLALDGPLVSIRKFRKDPFGMSDLVRLGSLTEEMAQLLEHAVRHRCNVLISGGTSSGKTSMLNALAVYVPVTERVVTIEDTAELSLKHPHVARMESRPSGLDGHGEINTRDLMRNSLRMRPDRIIVGEVRGAEVMEMLQAMNTGHDGSMATVHASSPRECLYRLEMLAGFAGFAGSELSLRRQIASALDFIVQIGRLPNGKRRVVSITEVTGVNDEVIAMQELFKHTYTEHADGEMVERWESGGLLPQTTKLLKLRQEMASKNLSQPGAGWLL